MGVVPEVGGLRERLGGTSQGFICEGWSQQDGITCEETFLSSALSLMCKIVWFYFRGSLSILLVERTCMIFGISHLKGLMARKFLKAFPL